MADSDRGEPIDVLLVEDDEGDVLMTKEAFEYYKIRNRLHVVTDGEQALQFVRRAGPYSDAPRPGLILLDVNLPRLSGLEVLAELKRDPDLLVIPVVMLTTSQAEEDILRSYELHANAYVSKPVDFEHFIDAIRQIDDFFLTLVKLPVLPLSAAAISSRRAARALPARFPGRRLLRTRHCAAPRRSAPRTSLRARK